MQTPFGAASFAVGTYQGQKVVFMPRHGAGHKTPPHLIPYRANLWALKEFGVTQILATAAVGSIRPEYAPGTLVLVNDFMDFTKTRPLTFHEGEGGVVHIDMTDPYCKRLRKQLLKIAKNAEFTLIDGGVYVCTEGPRFETKAEIAAYALLGGDVVGMTTVPEVILARELEICYATVGIVTNYCSGVTNHPLTVAEVMENMSQNIAKVKSLFFELVGTETNSQECECARALHEKGAL